MVEKEEKNLKKLYVADKKSMDKIEKLGSGRRVTDQIKALELFEENYSKLPLGRAHEFIEKKRQSKNKRVSEKAEDVYSNTIKERWGEITKNLRIFTQSNIINFQEISPQLASLSKNFGISKEVMDQINKSVNLPIIRLNKLLKEQQFEPFIKMSKVMESPIISMKHLSPILTASHYIQPLIEKGDSNKTLGELLQKEPKEMREELKDAIESEKEIMFNYEAYKTLSKIERFLRGLIQQKIIEPYQDILQNKLPDGLLDEWNKRKKQEEKNRLVDNGYELIEYSDFTDLKRILDKGRNIELFSDVANIEDLKGLTAKLHELDPIRKKIAHFRPLSKREFDKLRMYAEDILRIFKDQSTG